VRQDLYDSGQVRRIDDLRGITMGLVPPGRASATAALLAHGLQARNMSLDDLNIQALPFPDMIPAFANGALDAALMGEPFLLRARQQGSIVRVAGYSDFYNNYTVSALCFTPTFFDNRAAARGYVRAYLRAVREYRAALAAPPGDAARAAVHDVMADYTGIDVALVREMDPPGFDANGLPNRESMLYAYQYFRDNGVVPEPISESGFAALWGTDLVDEVLRDLGRLP
jgi:NitT/TauT family transport system substrate-binding protein